MIAVSNDLQGFKLLLKKIRKSYQIAKIIIEHTGNYQKNCVMFLLKHNLAVCVVNPNKVRNFAKAAGILAKTDKINAYIIAQHQEMLKKAKSLLTIDGFGKQTVNILLSYLSELGNIEKNKLSALCGLAPINHDSGKMHSLRCIYGGRKIVRNALYMATVSISVHNPIIRNH